MQLDELEQRIDILEQSGFVDVQGRRDLDAMVRVLTEGYGLPRTDDALGVIVTHVAAAFKRAKDGETINPLAPEIVEDVRSSEVFDKAKEIADAVADAMQSELSEDERDFILVHVGGLLIAEQANK